MLWTKASLLIQQYMEEIKARNLQAESEMSWQIQDTNA